MGPQRRLDDAGTGRRIADSCRASLATLELVGLLGKPYARHQEPPPS